MIGAILGDIVGSRFEFDNRKSKKFTLFHRDCVFTDDTVMTLAIAKALLQYDTVADYEAFSKDLVKIMHGVGRNYPDCGYGGRFYRWMISNDPKPYKSYGNGSAMRVSPVAYVARTLEECEKLATATAAVSHNHPQGIRGAVAVAGSVFLARKGCTMEDLRAYADQHYTIDFTLDGIRDGYGFYETCQMSVPQALEAFFESTSFEDAIRNAVSIGGDSDTIAAITGSVAEAFYGIDEDLKNTALSYLDEPLLEIAEQFIKKYMSKENEK